MEKFGFEGKLKITTIDKNTNEVLQTFEDKNKITIGSYDILYDLLSGKNSSITKIGIGTGGILNSEIKTVDFTDHDLYERILFTNITQIDKVVHTDKIEVVFKATAIFEDNYVISEAGLFNVNDIMFSRKCFSEFIVDNTINMLFEWSIFFTPYETN